MSQRRRKSGPGLTLFAFQDIIMSTSGIVIMIVLLLTLELVEQRTSSVQATDLFENTKLFDEVKETETKLNELRERLNQFDETIRTDPALSPRDLNRQIQDLRVQSDALAETVNDLQTELNTSSTRDGRLSEEQRKLQLFRQNLSVVEQEESRLRAEIETLTTENRPIFKFPQRDRRNGWLAVVSSSTVEIAPLGRVARPVIFQSKMSSLDFTDAADRFVRWIDKENATSAFFYLIVRPDGVEVFSKIADKLDQRSIRYGFDLTGSDQVILNAERGAAP